MLKTFTRVSQLFPDSRWPQEDRDAPAGTLRSCLARRPQAEGLWVLIFRSIGGPVWDGYRSDSVMCCIQHDRSWKPIWGYRK